MKIITILGARPQFIKASALCRAIKNGFNTQIAEIIVHTGQHYDDNMSQVFFDELQIPKPHYNLGIGGQSHNIMTGNMLIGLEPILIKEKPDYILVYGDTNSTLAGALVASKLHIPIAHVEAGLRSFNNFMPEEINRIITDRISDILFCPTEVAMQNCAHEALSDKAFNVGDIMVDVALYYQKIAQNSDILPKNNLTKQNYILATLHRQENTDDKQRLMAILDALQAANKNIQVVLPIHPRTKKIIHELGMNHLLNGLKILDPLPYIDMIQLQQNARIIMTDSGGIQKEAFVFQVPCITMRDQTEWRETITSGWNYLVGADGELIKKKIDFFMNNATTNDKSYPYGRGDSAEKILNILLTRGKNG